MIEPVRVGGGEQEEDERPLPQQIVGIVALEARGGAFWTRYKPRKLPPGTSNVAVCPAVGPCAKTIRWPASDSAAAV